MWSLGTTCANTAHYINSSQCAKHFGWCCKSRERYVSITALHNALRGRFGHEATFPQHNALKCCTATPQEYPIYKTIHSLCVTIKSLSLTQSTYWLWKIKDIPNKEIYKLPQELPWVFHNKSEFSGRRKSMTSRHICCFPALCRAREQSMQRLNCPMCNRFTFAMTMQFVSLSKLRLKFCHETRTKIKHSRCLQWMVMQEGCEHKSNKIEPTIRIMNVGIFLMHNIGTPLVHNKHC